MRSVTESVDLWKCVEDLAALRDFHGLDAVLSQIEPELLRSDLTLQYYQLLAAVQRGDTSTASEVYRRTQTALLRYQDSRLYRKYLNIIGILHTHHGRLADATDKFWQAYSIAATKNDMQLMADATMNIGIVADIQGKWAEALLAQTRSLCSFHTLGDADMIAGCHHNMGMTYKHLKKYERARHEFDTALEIFQARKRRQDAAATAIERSMLYVPLGEPQLAETMARTVYRQVRRDGNQRLIGEALRALGFACRALNQPRRARRYYCLAYSNALATNNVLLEAESAEGIALVLRDSHEYARAGEMAGKAVQLYTKMGSHWRADIAAKVLKDLP